jgi:ABC-type multidrug transport system ATPase subunit
MSMCICHDTDGLHTEFSLGPGVELAAKPQLLFLDEPTSGLSAQASWSIIQFLRRLADAGQAIM